MLYFLLSYLTVNLLKLTVLNIKGEVMNMLNEKESRTALASQSESTNAVDILERIFLSLKKNMAVRYKQLPISMRDLLVIKLISSSEMRGDTITPSDISREIDVTRAAVSQYISSLEKRGYIIGRADENDKRKTYLYLSDKAKELISGFSETLCNDVETVRSKMGHKRFGEMLNLAVEAAGILERTQAQ